MSAQLYNLLSRSSRITLLGVFLFASIIGGSLAHNLAYGANLHGGVPFPTTPDLGENVVCHVYGEANETNGVIPHLQSGEECPTQQVAQCSDGIDNDGNGLIDYPSDLGCSSAQDDSESGYTPPTPTAACSDSIDNDADGFIDSNDPNCHSDGDPTNSSSYVPSKNSESGNLPVCWNGLDDDNDGKVDLDDPGCENALDNDETNTTNGGGGTVAQCSNNVDDDGDGFTDTQDPNCHTDGDPTNADSYDPDIPSESGDLPVCWNGLDDDNDGKVDLDDPGCENALDNDETDPSQPAQCSDGIDNDNDGKVDLNDPGCSSAGDNDETDTTNGGGGQASQCSDGLDNDGDNLVDLDDPGCNNGSDNDETDATGGSSNTTTGPSGGGGTIVGLIDTSALPRPGGIGGSVEIPTAPTECDAYLTEFIRFGRTNTPEQVRRLQFVLKEFEGASVEITGVYDQRTLNAVHTFQKKYAGDILTPWGIKTSTGYVYLTTRKKVNEIFCRNTRAFPLSGAEQQIIQKTRAQVLEYLSDHGTAAQQGSNTTGGEQVTPDTEVPPAILNEIGDATDVDGNGSQLAGAGAADSSWYQSFWAWLRSIIESVSNTMRWTPESG